MKGLDWYDYGARMYESDGIRWGQMDPLADSTPDVTPYGYCGNNPIKSLDPNGKKVVIWYKNSKNQDQAFVFTGFHGRKRISYPKNSFINSFIKAYVYNTGNGGGEKCIAAVNNPKVTINVMDAREENDGKTEYYNNGQKEYIVFWNPNGGLMLTNGARQSPATQLEHEMDHAIDDITNHSIHRKNHETKDDNYDNKEEKRVIEGSERKTATHNGEGVRNDHCGTTYETINSTSTISKTEEK